MQVVASRAVRPALAAQRSATVARAFSAAASGYVHIPRAPAHRPVEAAREYEQLTLVDARPRAEWLAKRIAGSVNVPADDLNGIGAETAEALEKKQPTFVYCDSKAHFEPVGDEEASKSLVVADMLLDRGYEDVHVVEGDLDELVKTGFHFTTEQ
jgi:Rhodanese-like domain